VGKLHNTSRSINILKSTLFKPWIGLTKSTLFFVILRFWIHDFMWFFLSCWIFLVCWKCLEAFGWRMVKFHGDLKIFYIFLKMEISLTQNFGPISLVCWVLIEGITWSPIVKNYVKWGVRKGSLEFLQKLSFLWLFWMIFGHEWWCVLKWWGVICEDGSRFIICGGGIKWE